MGVNDYGDPYYDSARSDPYEAAYRKENANALINDTIKKVNKNQLKGLEALLSVLSDLSKSNAPITVDEEYMREEMKNLDYKLKDVEDAAKDERLYKGIETTESLGIAISAAINNVIKPGEKGYIKSIKPIDYLFYNLEMRKGMWILLETTLGKTL